ncbi:DUF1090 domain-containing protein [Mixta intestinalis]|uniref:Protein YqjC n=1 Tax=Mixta intestinalis TaxID=1615494 RepID=A0A6P1Q3T7_9GAMM|nr:DUF1090 domain-containing protein [Mixta intestinalis]QHM72515.1 hypothetical protein C7M51_02828 [Mixta intestinalis]
MKFRTSLFLALVSLSGFTQAAGTLCMQKEKDIEREISHAQQHDNQRRVNGLERALTEVRASCTDEKLKAAHQENIEAKQREVAEREKDLKDAQDDGDEEKIAKRQRKLQEEREELKALQSATY